MQRLSSVVTFKIMILLEKLMKTSIILKISAVLWLVWGVVHAIAGIMTVGGDTATAVQAIADAVDPDLLSISYPDAAGAIINQHGWNLFWFGAVTIIGGVFIWCKNVTAIWVTAMIGGLADLGYFIFLDLGGYVNFVPGTIMTIISSLAIILSLIAYFMRRSTNR